MTTTAPERPHKDWTTPAELAARMGRPLRWVEDQMALYASTGGRKGLPSIKVGQFRWWTPACMAKLEQEQLAKAAAPAPAAADDWGHAARGAGR